MNLVLESQSQGTFLQDTGNGKASTATARLQVIHNNLTGTAWRVKKISANNSNSRVARGVREFAEEINTLYPGMPISWSSVGVQGNSLSQWAAGGVFEALWGQLKALHGTPQPFALYMLGHSNPTASYETVLGNVIAKCTSDYATPARILHADTARYAQSGTTGSHTDSLNAREGIRDRVANNLTTDWFAAHPQVIKCDSNDNGPHPMDADVGQGRHGALLAWGIMGRVRAVEDEPVTLTTATKISGGTVVRLGFGPVNQSTGMIVSVDPAPIAIVGQDIAIGKSVPVGAVAVSLAGQDIGISLTVPIGAANVPLAGQDIAVVTPAGGVTVAVDPASLVISGQSVGIALSLPIAASSLVLAVQPIGISRSVPVTPSAITIAGQDLGVSIAGGSVTVLVDAVALSLLGQDVAMTVTGSGLSTRRIATAAQSRNGGIISRG